MRWDWGIEEHDETWNYRTSVNDADFDANSKHAAWAQRIQILELFSSLYQNLKLGKELKNKFISPNRVCKHLSILFEVLLKSQ